MAVSPGDEKLDALSLVLFLLPRYHRLLVHQIQAPTAYSALTLNAALFGLFRAAFTFSSGRPMGKLGFPSVSLPENNQSLFYVSTLFCSPYGFAGVSSTYLSCTLEAEA